MKRIAIIILVARLLDCTQLFGYGTLDQNIQYRHTDKGTAVPVDRKTYTIKDLKWMALDEISLGKQFPEAQLLRSAFDYELLLHHTRNCHDFAFGPYMSCMCNASGTQKEAWWMDDPTQNWKDGSMVNIVTSVGFAGRREYLFKTADLAPLPFIYQDVFGLPYALPACPLDDPQNQIPKHSAILVNWLTPPPFNNSLSVGVYISKWGDMGIYLHRWGKGYVPDWPGAYIDSQVLRIFAPRPGWNPPFIVHSPWGL